MSVFFYMTQTVQILNTSERKVEQRECFNQRKRIFYQKIIDEKQYFW